MSSAYRNYLGVFIATATSNVVNPQNGATLEDLVAMALGTKHGLMLRKDPDLSYPMSAMMFSHTLASVMHGERNPVPLTNCARCGKDHPAITFHRLDNPAGEYSWWSVCPVTEQPILMKIEAAAEPIPLSPRAGSYHGQMVLTPEGAAILKKDIEDRANDSEPAR